MITSFRHKGLQRLFESGTQRGVPAQFALRLRRQLDYLHAAKVINDMDLPGFELHPLKGDRKGTWAISVSGNWRMTFQFSNGEASDVDLEDYH